MMRFVCCALTVLLFAGSAFAQAGKRSGVGPCRQGALALIAMLDGKEDNTADYRHAYDAVVTTCGPAAPAGRAAPAQDRGACRDLALKVLDTIEVGKMNTPGFARARDAFARSCAPR